MDAPDGRVRAFEARHPVGVATIDDALQAHHPHRIEVQRLGQSPTDAVRIPLAAAGVGAHDEGLAGRVGTPAFVLLVLNGFQYQCRLVLRGAVA